MRVWRLVRPNFAPDAYSGEGGLHAAGRWTPKGVRVVYTSGSLALAVLEVLVHLEIRHFPDEMRAVPADVPDGLRVRTLTARDLPRAWETIPAPSKLQEFGAQWIKSADSAILKVPSAVVPLEWNYLLNPAHREFRRIKLGRPQRFKFDERLIGKA